MSTITAPSLATKHENDKRTLSTALNAFLDCLVRRDWVARGAEYMRRQEHWQHRCVTEAGPS